MVIGTYISIITLNIHVNGLKAPTKRHRLAEWIQKQDVYICCLQETNFRPRDTYRLKLRHRCREQTYGHQGGIAVGGWVWGWWCYELDDWD